jgi:hypothetical protein
MKEETKQKLSEALRGNDNAKGKPKPDGFGEKIGKLLRGQKRSKAQRQRISEGKMGHVVSEETKDKISKANKGRKRTHEQRMRMAQAQRDRYANQREQEKGENAS